jgi:undecaprenyl phosphate N,N'-diacetylbacillosamine 1-phosphate transferase
MYRIFLKRVIDLLIALIILPFWLLLLITISPIIFFQDRGTIFYNAPRLGRDGKIFKMYKFRSMKMNAPDIRNEDGSTFNSENDPRLTNIGRFIRKTSIDETPQLLNIIKGDMSIIGPRPDLPEMLNKYSEFERKKLFVRPGITGYNQAYYRNSNDLEDRFKNDVFYSENISLMLDIKIFFKTIFTIFKRENVYRNHTNLPNKVNNQTESI